MKAIGVAASIVIGLYGCSSSKASGGDFAEGGVNTGGAPSTGGSGSGDSTGSGGETGDPCPSRNFSTAPVECLQDWSHATESYPDTCDGGALTEGGCQTTGQCGLDAIFYYYGGTESIYCFYSQSTGNLVGVREPSKTPSCTSFDLDYPPPGFLEGTCE